MMNFGKVLIIGKRSILSNELNKTIEGSLVFSSNEFENIKFYLENFNGLNIIYNTNFKSTLLNKKDINIIDFSNYSIHYLAKYITLFKKYKKNINCILFTSSCAVYGESTLADERDEYKITNLYSSLKVASELMLKKYLIDTNINLIFARIFNMYGEEENFSVISKILDSFKNDRIFNLNNNGEGIRDYIHVRDVVNIYKILLIKKFNGVINISTSKGISIKEVIEKSREIFKIQLLIKNDKNLDLKICIGSNRLLNEKFEYKNFINLFEYIKTFK